MNGLGWKIFGLFVSIFLIWGGLSGEMVLRGTDSSEGLVVVGFLLLAADIYSIASHQRNKQKQEAEANMCEQQREESAVPEHEAGIPAVQAGEMEVAASENEEAIDDETAQTTFTGVAENTPVEIVKDGNRYRCPFCDADIVPIVVKHAQETALMMMAGLHLQSVDMEPIIRDCLYKDGITCNCGMKLEPCEQPATAG